MIGFSNQGKIMSKSKKFSNKTRKSQRITVNKRTSKTKNQANHEPIEIQSDASIKTDEQFPFLVHNLSQSIYQEISGEQVNYNQALEVITGFPVKVISEVFCKLAQEHPQLTLPLLEKATESSNPQVLVGAIQALSFIHTTEALRILTEVDEQIKWDEDKSSVRKELSRSIHRLKSQKILLPEYNNKVSKTPTVLARTKGSTSQEQKFNKALVSNYDTDGNLSAFLILETKSKKYEIIMLMLNDKLGLTKCTVFSFNQRQLDEFLQQWEVESFQAGIRLFTVDRSYVNYLVTQHLIKNRLNDITLPANFTYLRKYFPEVDYDQHPVYERIQADSIEESLNFLLSKSEILIQTPEMQNWLLNPADIANYAKRLIERSKSRIIISDAVMLEFKEKLAQEVIEELFNEELTQLYSRRLEHMSLLFYRTEQISNARIALAVAIDLIKHKNPNRNYFIKKLAISSLEALAAAIQFNNQN